MIARIGRLPATLADRCVIFRMQRKTANERCERLRNLKGGNLRRQCARFVEDHAAAIASAEPQIPGELNDRAADIWEPLLALADLAGGEWPGVARQAAVSVSVAAQENNPAGSLLLDLFYVFLEGKVDRMFSHTLVEKLNGFGQRPWSELRQGKALTDLWLSRQLRPYGISPRNLRIHGTQAKGYLQGDMMDVFRRYISKSDFQALVAGSEVVEAAGESQLDCAPQVGSENGNASEQMSNDVEI